jgi:c-di-GMP-related signal transduction protein
LECSRLNGCPFYNDIIQKQQGIGAIYKNKYCMGNHDQCARFIVAGEVGSEYVPVTLYPNMLDIAKDIIEKAKKDKGSVTESSKSSFIARQPIFDRNMGIYGYELLYRQNSNNFFVQIDDDQATAELIYNLFFVFGLYDLTDGTKAFINFSKELLDSDIPSLLPKQSIIVEILERNHATLSTIEACRRIKAAGYSLALDDFVFDDDNKALLEYADIVKIDFPSLDPSVQSELINKYKKKIKFLAEKVETREEYSLAMDMGYELFQGYFFCKPSMVSSKDISSLNINVFNIINELNIPDPNFYRIASIIQGDLGLSLKLLRLTNSVFYGTHGHITSILQALSFMGINELHQWISIMLLKNYASIDNSELIKMSLIRAKFMELLSLELYPKKDANNYFFTGLFSFIDVLLNQSMDKVLLGLPLSESVKRALLGEDNPQRRLLNCVIAYETDELEKSEEQEIIEAIGHNKFMSLYIDSIKWVKSLNY